MSDRVSSVYGTERDKVNCSFYFKIGACRHGERCSRKHVKPNYSQTVLLSKIYQNPTHVAGCKMSPEELQEHFDAFFEDMFIELAKYGEIERLNVCDNVGEHLIGNVYVRYRYEEDASRAVESLNNRFYAKQPIYAELSPVTDFGEACCRQYENSECARNGFCNFMHLKTVSRKLEKLLYAAQEASLRMLAKSKKSSHSRHSKSHRVSRSRSPPERTQTRKRYSPREEYGIDTKYSKSTDEDIHVHKEKRRTEDRHRSDDKHRSDEKHREDGKHRGDIKHRDDAKHRDDIKHCPDDKHNSDDKHRSDDRYGLDDRHSYTNKYPPEEKYPGGEKSNSDDNPPSNYKYSSKNTRDHSE